jgi:hypothetical protein
MSGISKIIKSKERVRDLAEVFTADKEVNAMLDLVKYLSENVENTLLEPSCGNGNFLITILKRKLDTVKSKYKNQIDIEFYIVKAVASIYGIDISEENVLEARERMNNEIKNFYSYKFNTKKPNEGFWDSVRWVLERNVIVGDMLNKIQDVVLVEYTTPKKYLFKRQEFRLVDQFKNKKAISTLFDTQSFLQSYKISNYLKLC